MAVLLAIAAFAAGMAGTLKKDTSELPVYVLGAERMLGGEEIYHPTEFKPFTYPPFFGTVFVPLTWVTGEVAQRIVFYCLNVGLLVLTLWAIRRAILPQLREKAGAREWLVWLLVALVAARHVAAVFQNQSHDLVIVALVALGATAMTLRREVGLGGVVGGLTTGLAAACKATPLLFLPLFLGQLRVVSALAMLVAAVGATLLPDLITPRDDGSLWVTAWYDTLVSKQGLGRPADAGDAWHEWNSLNQNLAGTLYRLSTPVADESDLVFDVSLWNPSREVLRAVTAAGQLLILALLAFAAWPGRSRGLDDKSLGWRRFGEASMVACAMLLLSPMSSKSHFGLLLLPAAWLAVDWLCVRRSWGSAVSLLAAFVLGTLTTKGVLGKGLGNEFLARGAVTWATGALWLGCVGVLSRRSWSGHPSTSGLAGDR